MKARHIAGIAVGVGMLVLPLVAAAQANSFDPSRPANPFNPSAPANSFDTSCGGNGGVFVLCNPLTAKSFCGLLLAIFNAILVLAIPVAMLFIVYAGFKFVTARGRPEALQKAKMNLLYVVIGIALFLGAWLLAKIIANTIVALGGDSSLTSCK